MEAEWQEGSISQGSGPRLPGLRTDLLVLLACGFQLAQEGVGCAIPLGGDSLFPSVSGWVSPELILSVRHSQSLLPGLVPEWQITSCNGERLVSGAACCHRPLCVGSRGKLPWGYRPPQARRGAVWLLSHFQPLQEESFHPQAGGNEFTNLASCSVSVWALGIDDGVLRSIWDMRAEMTITSFRVKNSGQRDTGFLIRALP